MIIILKSIIVKIFIKELEKKQKIKYTYRCKFDRICIEREVKIMDQVEVIIVTGMSGAKLEQWHVLKI